MGRMQREKDARHERQLDLERRQPFGRARS
jgi:hypothetical protein